MLLAFEPKMLEPIDEEDKVELEVEDKEDEGVMLLLPSSVEPLASADASEAEDEAVEDSKPLPSPPACECCCCGCCGCCCGCCCCSCDICLRCKLSTTVGLSSCRYRLCSVGLVLACVPGSGQRTSGTSQPIAASVWSERQRWCSVDTSFFSGAKSCMKPPLLKFHIAIVPSWAPVTSRRPLWSRQAVVRGLPRCAATNSNMALPVTMSLQASSDGTRGRDIGEKL